MDPLDERQTQNTALVRWLANRVAGPTASPTEELQLASLGAVLWSGVAVYSVAVVLALRNIDAPLPLLLMMGLTLTNVGLLLALRRGVSVNLAADVTVCSLFAAFSALTLASGAAMVGMLYVSLVVPAMATLFRPAKVAIPWIVAAIAIAGVATLLRNSGVELPISLSPNADEALRFPSYTAVAVLSCAVLGMHLELRRVGAAEAAEHAHLRAAADAQARDVRREYERLQILSSGIAHEFNNFLTSIRGYAELAAHAASGEVSLDKCLNEIERASDRAAGVVSDLLAFATRGPREVECVDLSEALREVIATARPIIDASIVIEAPLPSTGPWVEVNPSQLTAAVLNLLKNAGEAYDGSPGVVRLSLGLRSFDQIEATGPNMQTLWEATEYACIGVDDSGRGISEDDAERIFAPYYSSKRNGRGLGLAIVVNFVNAHGGAIRTEALRPGSRFELLLPTVAEPTEGIPSIRATGETFRGLHVLVVDDDEAVRRVICQLLAQRGAQVLEAEDGESAIEILRREPSRIDVAVLDLEMPGMGGEKALHALRALRSDLPVAVISGHAEQEFDRLRQLEGVVALSKPFSMARLAATLEKLVARRSTS